MDRRLVVLPVVGCLAAAGVWLIHQGIEARVAALPSMGVSVSESSGSSAATLEWRSPQANRQLSDALAEIGAARFHVGLGLAVFAWTLALAWLLGVSSSKRSSRFVSALWLIPAAWGLGSLAIKGGPWAPSANGAMESLWVYAPVFGLFLSLGLGFRSGDGRD